MVVVKIELWPNGDKEKARTLGAMTISNDGTGDASSGNYDVGVCHGGSYFGKPGLWKRGRVRSFRRSMSPYHLVARALSSCGIR